jgi:6-phosphofructokinase 1
MNIAVAQSGGPTCAINASLLGVFRHALKYDEIDTVYGAVNGIEGLIKDRIVDLKTIICEDEDVELIRQTPSTVLGSCRYKLPRAETGAEVYEKIYNTLKKHDLIGYVDQNKCVLVEEEEALTAIFNEIMREKTPGKNGGGE